MRIVQLLTQHHGGPVDHVADLAAALHDLGHTVLVLGPHGAAQRQADGQGVAWTSIWVRSMWDLYNGVRAARIIRDFAPDVIHCQDRRSGLMGRLIGKLFRTPTVYTLHGAPDGLAHLVPNNARVAPERRQDRLLYLRLERLLARLSGGRVVVASSALATYARQSIGIPRESVDVIPNGINLGRYDSKRTEGARFVWLGLMVPVKRLDLLITAVSLAPNVHVTLIGDGPLRASLTRLVDELGVTKRVVFRGFEPYPAKSLRDASVAILCSDAENCPLALLQAMASRCAVIATAVGGVPELVRDGRDGLLVPAGDAQALANALELLWTNASLRDRLGNAALLRSTNFDVRYMAQALVETYHRAQDETRR